MNQSDPTFPQLTGEVNTDSLVVVEEVYYTDVLGVDVGNRKMRKRI